MADQLKNVAYSTVATAPSPASSGTNFSATPFNATVWPAGTQPTSSNTEIVRVTNCSIDTMTIPLAHQSTGA